MTNFCPKFNPTVTCLCVCVCVFPSGRRAAGEHNLKRQDGSVPGGCVQTGSDVHLHQCEFQNCPVTSQGHGHQRHGLSHSLSVSPSQSDQLDSDLRGKQKENVPPGPDSEPNSRKGSTSDSNGIALGSLYCTVSFTQRVPPMQLSLVLYGQRVLCILLIGSSI